MECSLGKGCCYSYIGSAWPATILTTKSQPAMATNGSLETYLHLPINIYGLWYWTGFKYYKIAFTTFMRFAKLYLLRLWILSPIPSCPLSCTSPKNGCACPSLRPFSFIGILFLFLCIVMSPLFNVLILFRSLFLLLSRFVHRLISSSSLLRHSAPTGQIYYNPSKLPVNLGLLAGNVSGEHKWIANSLYLPSGPNTNHSPQNRTNRVRGTHWLCNPVWDMHVVIREGGFRRDGMFWILIRRRLSIYNFLAI